MAQSFRCFNLDATDQMQGASSSAAIACAEGDTFLLTATQRFVSGGMQPRVYLAFMDQGLTTVLGTLSILAIITDNGWHIASALGTVPPGAQAAVITTDCQYIGGASETIWEVSDYRIAQNGSPVYAQLDTFAVPAITLREFVYPLYYLGLLTSQYRLLPQYNAWVATLIQPQCDLLAFYTKLGLNLDTAQGVLLDVIGQIIGVSRTLPFTPTTNQVNSQLQAAVGTGSQVALVTNTINMVLGGTLHVWYLAGMVQVFESVVITAINPGVSFTAVFAIAHAAGATVNAQGAALNPVLSDTDYLTLIRAKIAQNQWKGSIGELYKLWNQLFPLGQIIFFDNQDMTATIVLAGEFTATQIGMIVNGLIVPRPQAVLYNYIFAQLPLLGFDRNDSNIAGFDTGHFA